METMNYKNYHLSIWDKIGWETGGETVGWVIEIYEPDRYIQGGALLEESEILLTQKEAEQLGLVERFEYADDWDRETAEFLFDFIEGYDVPKRVYDLLEKLPD